jgi:hypothetical protein
MTASNPARINQDADPPEDWIAIMHHDLFPIDLEWDTKKKDNTPTTNDNLIDAYDYAKKATERM